jgi:mannose-1-phosphate guanylyltransferase
VILAGGFATRLRPLSCTRPKILFPLLNKPFLQWIFERLAKNNIKEAILAVNYQTEAAIKNMRISTCGVHVTYSHDPPQKPLGTGGPIKKAEKRIGHDDSFLVINGDIFADLNYMEILKMHEEKGGVATIALHEVEDPSRFGVAELLEDNRISRFIEKPRREEAPTNLINAGVYAFSPKIFEYIPKGQTVSMEREIFPKLAMKGLLYGYIYSGLWMDIGKPEDYLELNKTLLLSNFFTIKQKFKNERGVSVNSPVIFDKGVSIGKGSVIGPHVVLGRNVKVGSNVYIRDSIIFPHVEISDSSSIRGAIIGEGVIIGRDVKIESGCVLGDHSKVRDGVVLTNGVLICPAREVVESVTTPKCLT